MMENLKYNVLWLDDVSIEELDCYGIRDDFPQLSIEKVTYTDECMEHLEYPSKYSAVILDAQGKSRSHLTDEASLKGFLTLVDKAQQKKMPVYVYSGEIHNDEGSFNIVEDELKKRGIYKNDMYIQKPEIYTLFEKIVSDLEDKYYLLQQEPEILENIFKYNIDKDCVMQIMRWREDHSLPFPEYKTIRSMIVDNIQNKELKGFLGIAGDLDYKKCTSLLFSKLEAAVIMHFKEIVNSDLHSDQDNGETDDYYNAIIADSFIYLMKWYNRFRHNIEAHPTPCLFYEQTAKSTQQSGTTSNPQSLSNRNDVVVKNEPTGVVERDDWGNYIVSGCILNVNQGEKFLGKEVRVERTIKKTLASKISLV